MVLMVGKYTVRPMDSMWGEGLDVKGEGLDVFGVETPLFLGEKFCR